MRRENPSLISSPSTNEPGAISVLASHNFSPIPLEGHEPRNIQVSLNPAEALASLSIRTSESGLRQLHYHQRHLRKYCPTRKDRSTCWGGQLLRKLKHNHICIFGKDAGRSHDKGCIWDYLSEICRPGVFVSLGCTMH